MKLKKICKAAWLEKAGGEGKAAGVEEAGLEKGCQVEGGCRWIGKDWQVEIASWRWQGEKITE